MQDQAPQPHNRRLSRPLGILTLLTLTLALFMPGLAVAQFSTCTSDVEITVLNPGPFFLDDTLRVSADIGAKSIVGGTHLDIDTFGFALNCLRGQGFASCIDDGNTVEFLGNLETDCLDSDGNPVELIVPESNVIPLSSVSGKPIRTPANTQCNVQFDMAVRELNGIDRRIDQALGWPVPGRTISKCNNGLSSSASATMAFFIQECGIDLEKQVSVDGGATWLDADSEGAAPQLLLGGDAQYQLIITNTGTTPFTSPVKVVDAALGIDTTVPALGPGQSTTVTSAQIPALSVPGRCQVVGSLENESSVEGMCRGGASPVSESASDSAFIVCTGTSAIDIEKSTNGEDADTAPGPLVPVGSQVNWTYDVTNTGTLALSNVSVVDNQGVVVTCPQDTLAAGEMMTCTASGTATAGQYANVGTATGTPPAGPTVNDDDPSHYFGSDPSINIEKSTNGQDADLAPGPSIAVGNPVNWAYVVTNTGNVALTGVTVTDDKLGAVTCPQDTLAIGEMMTCTANGTATEGQYANLGSVVGTPPVGGDVTDDDPSHYFGVTTGIDIEKATNGEDADSPTGPFIPVGGQVNWTYKVTNLSNVTLTNVVVTDSQGETVTCPQDTLDAGAMMTCTASGTAEAGQYANIGSVTANPPTGPAVNDDDPSHYFGSDPGIDIEKSTNGEDADTPTGPLLAVNGAVNWLYVVTNTGNVTLTNVAVSDDQLGSITCPKNILTAGESMNCSANGTAQEGQYANLGSVVGTPPVGNDVTDDDPSHYFGVTTGIDIEKATNGEDADTPTGPNILVGEDVTWSYEVTNLSNVTLTNVAVTDDQLGAITCPQDTLTAGEMMTCTAMGTATEGQYANLGSVTGTPPEGPPVNDDDPSHYLGIVPADISVDKSVENVLVNQDGTIDVTYRATVSNTGGQVGVYDLFDTLLIDEAVTATSVVSPVTHVPGTEADTDGTIITPPIGDFGTGAKIVDDESLDFGKNEAFEFTLKFTVNNDTITVAGANCEVDDDQGGNTGLTNLVEVFVNDEKQDEDDVCTEIELDPEITILKEISIDGGNNFFDANDVNTAVIAVFPSDAEYRITVGNTGNVPLKNVEVDDPELSIVDYLIGNLAVGQVEIILSGDLPALAVTNRCDARGTFINTATASGESVQDDTPVSNNDAAVLKCIGEPHITIKKEISPTGTDPWYDDETPPQEFPSPAWYRITVTNDGTAPLVDVEVMDGDLGVLETIGSLDVGEVVVLEEGSIPAVPELAVAERCDGPGEVGNTAMASGTSADDPTDTVNDSDTATLVCVGSPMIEIVKEISVDGSDPWLDADTEGAALVTTAPSDAYYRITVRNIGPVDLTNILLNDGALGIVDQPVADIPAGGEVVLTSGELPALYYPDRCTSRGTFGNTANVKGESAETGSETSLATDSAWLECTGTPEIQILKQISVTGADPWYEDFTPSQLAPSDAYYRLIVRNTGTADLENVTVSDATLGIVNELVGDLVIGAEVTLDSGDIAALFQQDRCTSAGEVVNTASATGTSVDFPFDQVNDSDSATLVCDDEEIFDDACENGKPSYLKVRYTGVSVDDNQQGTSDIINPVTLPGSFDPSSAYIVVRNNKNGIIYQALHTPGQTFQYTDILAQGAKKVPPNSYFYIYDDKATFDNGGAEAQYIQFHTSCSEPLENGDQFGVIQIIGGIY